ncbi:MAG: hypothetical protein H2038_06425 [Brevundimonas sp.]|jgi:hypothetical protein|uniref:hypothetical protein n=1 Tax=Brevundimonas sp. TaxID=1871086 RepID=UPI0017E310E5|nr:hypothetical protein [Brevundimonas sp.]MBA4804267.1 hypothetical protein [Brevundimonas sp.]
MLAAVIALLLLPQTAPAATGQVVWSEPPPPAAEAPAAPAPPPIPDSARTDPYGYERAQCNPMIRGADESLEACQSRVRSVLAAHLGAALPAGLAPEAAADSCRQEAGDDGYGLECARRGRSVPAGPQLRERTCTTRPRVTDGGGVAFREECTVNDQEERDEGLRIRLGGED